MRHQYNTDTTHHHHDDKKRRFVSMSFEYTSFDFQNTKSNDDVIEKFDIFIGNNTVPTKITTITIIVRTTIASKIVIYPALIEMVIFWRGTME